MNRGGLSRVLSAAFVLLAAGAGRLTGQNALHGDPIRISRAAGAITVDGDLSDPGWQGATRVETWYETNPGDNTPPKVGNIGYLAYDDRFLYAGFQFLDPQISRLRAPYGDRDNVSSSTDYGGIILDTQNEGKRAILFLANPRGIQYDAMTDDSLNPPEDSSPDWFWDSAGKVGKDGWQLEIRVPFSSLRYAQHNPQTWRIMLYRNYPRDFRYQFFSMKLPRGGNCFICRSNLLTGLEELPEGGKLVVAPFVTGTQEAQPEGDVGTPLEEGDAEGDAGLDLKWTPDENTALDLALNPDFSQIESDVAQIGVNERFALLFPEKRPFFLEGLDLFGTPFQAVYTRTITSPRWGVRGTGRFGSTSYTALVAEDRGGGSVVLPGPNESVFVDQDFRSYVGLGRLRHDLGRSFISMLATDREIRGGGFNRVLGPDFEWRPTEQDQIVGQLLYSWSETPDRPDLAAEWDGRKLSGHAGQVWWFRSTPTWDYFAQYKDVADEFRADNGFLPQVGYRETEGELGYTFRPTGLVRRLRTFLIGEYQAQRDSALIFRQISPGIGLDAFWNSFVRLRMGFDKVRAGPRTFDRNHLIYEIRVNPGRLINQLGLIGSIGEEVDFDNSRPGDGADITAFATIRPTDHLELRFDGARRWLDVDTPEARDQRLFTAQVSRLRAQYTFSSRVYLRLVGQYVETKRDPSLYTFEVSRKDGAFSGSALFAYKLNWQSVLFLGYGDERLLTEEDSLERSARQLFLKISYAFQR